MNFLLSNKDKDFEQAEVGITLCEALIARNGSVMTRIKYTAGRRLRKYISSSTYCYCQNWTVGFRFEPAFQLLKENKYVIRNFLQW